MAWSDLLLSEPDKMKRFRELFIVPLSTNELCEEIFTEFPRALQAYNKYIKNSFTSEELELDFKKYLDQIGFNDVWQQSAKDQLRTRINSFVIFDMPATQKGDRPEPYMYFLDIEAVRDVHIRPGTKGTVEYISFVQDITWDEQQAGIIEKYAVLDDVYYRIFTKIKDGDFAITSEVSHGLGYCPAIKFWNDTVNKRNPLNSKSPITNSIGQMDRYLFWFISVEYYKMYGMFPIYWGYNQKCDYRDEVNGATCDSKGVISWITVDGTVQTPHHAKCPKCQARKAVGPGTFIGVDPPALKEQPDLREPFGMIDISVEALKFMEEWLEKEEKRLKKANTGKMDATSDTAIKAINEEQVASQHDGEKNVLMGIKSQYELVMEFAYRTLARMRYQQAFLFNTTDLGDGFFLQSEAELNNAYQAAKTTGRPNFELASRREFMYLTKYHNNPEELERLNIVQNLEPYQDNSQQELITLGIKDADPTGFFIKLNFNSFVKRFERENLPITRFGNALSFENKINAIYDVLVKYAEPLVTSYTKAQEAAAAKSKQPFNN